MSIKMKMLKNLISVLCAATIATSGVVTSVSATKTAGNTSSTSKNKKEDLKSKYNEAKENYENFSEVEGSLDKIKNSKAIIRSVSDIAVEFVKLCDICEKIVNPVNGDEISEDKVVEAIGKLDRFNKRVTTLQNKIENMVVKQEAEDVLSELESEQAKPKLPQKPLTERQKRLQDVARRQELVQTKRQRDIDYVYLKVVNKNLEIEEFIGRNEFNGDIAAAWRMIFFGSAWQAFEDEYKVLCEGKISPDAHKEFIERANKLIRRLDRFKRKYGIDKLMKDEAIKEFTNLLNKKEQLEIQQLTNATIKPFNRIFMDVTNALKNTADTNDLENELEKRKQEYKKINDEIAETKKQYAAQNASIEKRIKERELAKLMEDKLAKKTEAASKIGQALDKAVKSNVKRTVMNNIKKTAEMNDKISKLTDTLDKAVKRNGMNAMKANDQEIIIENNKKISKFADTLSKASKRIGMNAMKANYQEEKQAEKIQANWRGYNGRINAKKKEFEALYSNFAKVAKDCLSWAEKQDNIYHDVYQKCAGLGSVKSALKNDYTLISERLKGAKTLEELNQIVERYKKAVDLHIRNMNSLRKDYEEEKAIGRSFEALKNGINKRNKINVMSELHSLYTNRVDEEKSRALAKQLAEESIRNEEIEKNRKANEEKERIAKEQKENMEREQKQKFNKAKKEVKDKFNKITLGDDYLSLTLITNDEVSKIEKMKKKIEEELKSLKDPAKDMDKVSGLNNEVEDFGRAVKELAGKPAQTSKNNGVKNNDDVLREKLDKKIEEFDKKCNQALQKLTEMPKDGYWLEHMEHDHFNTQIQKHTVEDERKLIYSIINKGKSNFEKSKIDFQSNSFEQYCEAIDTYIEELDRSIARLNAISNKLVGKNKDVDEEKKTDRVAKKKKKVKIVIPETYGQKKLKGLTE